MKTYKKDLFTFCLASIGEKVMLKEAIVGHDQSVDQRRKNLVSDILGSIFKFTL